MIDRLSENIRKLGAVEAASTPSEQYLARQICILRERWIDNRLQLAAVGQFKRGKSTLLNALLGSPILPTGVVPLTALPIFIAYDENVRVEATFTEGQREPCRQPTLEELATERGNPHNIKGVERIDVGVPAPMLADGLVLIDTPGIGSAELHNSEAAIAALPECDAALFILSPDPPITEAELAYLDAVRKQAALILPVLTKADTVGREDLADVLGYLAPVLERHGVSEPIIAVSARSPTTGLDRLQARIGALGGDTRRRLLEQAIVGKLIATLDDLAFQNDASLAALRLPISEVDARIALFRTAVDAISREGNFALDLTSADRRRLLDLIDREAEAVRTRVQAALLGTAPADAGRDNAFAALSRQSSQLFEAEYRGCAALVGERLAAIAERSRTGISAALRGIREAAADVLGVPFRAPELNIPIEAPKALAWVERERESMNPLPSGMLDFILPAALREKRQQAWRREEIERLAVLNTENLRWTLRQQVEDILRRFDIAVRDQLSSAAADVTGLIERARALRIRSEQEAQSEIEGRLRRSDILDACLRDLTPALEGKASAS